MTMTFIYFTVVSVIFSLACVFCRTTSLL